MIKKVKEEAAADDILFQEINEELKQEKIDSIEVLFKD